MEAVGQLTGGIAHDFNNMLAVIIGSLNLSPNDELGKGRNRRGPLHRGSHQMVQIRQPALTQRLLAFSRQQPLAPEVHRTSNKDGRRDERSCSTDRWENSSVSRWFWRPEFGESKLTPLSWKVSC